MTVDDKSLRSTSSSTVVLYSFAIFQRLSPFSTVCSFAETDVAATPAKMTPIAKIIAIYFFIGSPSLNLSHCLSYHREIGNTVTRPLRVYYKDGQIKGVLLQIS